MANEGWFKQKNIQIIVQLIRTFSGDFFRGRGLLLVPQGHLYVSCNCNILDEAGEIIRVKGSFLEAQLRYSLR